MKKRLKITSIAATMLAFVLFLFKGDSKDDEEDGYSKENLEEAKEDAKTVGICDTFLKRFASRADWKKSKENEKLREKIAAPNANIPVVNPSDTRLMEAQERMRQQGEGML